MGEVKGGEGGRRREGEKGGREGGGEGGEEGEVGRRRKRNSIHKPVPKVKVELCFFPSSRVPLSHNLCCKRDEHPCTYHLGVLEDQ